MLTFVFLSEGDVRVHKTASNAMGGGGVRKAIFIEQLKFLFSEKTQICHCILIIRHDGILGYLVQYFNKSVPVTSF